MSAEYMNRGDAMIMMMMMMRKRVQLKLGDVLMSRRREVHIASSWKKVFKRKKMQKWLVVVN